MLKPTYLIHWLSVGKKISKDEQEGPAVKNRKYHRYLEGDTETKENCFLKIEGSSSMFILMLDRKELEE